MNEPIDNQDKITYIITKDDVEKINILIKVSNEIIDDVTSKQKIIMSWLYFLTGYTVISEIIKLLKL